MSWRTSNYTHYMPILIRLPETILLLAILSAMLLSALPASTQEPAPDDPDRERIITQLTRALDAFEHPMHYEIKQIARRAPSTLPRLEEARAQFADPPFWRDALISVDETWPDFAYVVMSVQLAEGQPDPEKDFTNFAMWKNGRGTNYRENLGQDPAKSSASISDQQPEALDFVLTPRSGYSGPPGFIGLREILASSDTIVERIDEETVTLRWTSEDGTYTETWSIQTKAEFIYPIKAHAIADDFEATFEVLQGEEIIIRDNTIFGAVEMRFERAATDGYDSWIAEITNIKPLPHLYPDNFEIIPIDDVSMRDADQEDHAMPFRRSIGQAIVKQFSGRQFRSLNDGNAPEPVVDEIEDVTETQPTGHAAPADRSSDTYAVLIAPIIIILAGIAAALSYHKVLK